MRWTAHEDFRLTLDDAGAEARAAALGALMALRNSGAVDAAHDGDRLIHGVEAGEIGGASLASLSRWCHDQSDDTGPRDLARDASTALFGFVVPTVDGVGTSTFFWRVARRLGHVEV